MRQPMAEHEPQLKMQAVMDRFAKQGSPLIADDGARDLLMGAAGEWMALAAPKLRPGDRALLGALVTAAYQMGMEQPKEGQG